MTVSMKTLLAQNRLLRVCALGQLCSAKLVEMIGFHGGFDAVWLDQEHVGLTIPQIEEAARAGNVVIVGRGGAYILRDFPGALHVFLRADTAVRVKTVMDRYSITSEDEARRRIKLTDENWTAYINQVYGHDRNLAGHYDMVLDTGRLGYETTVKVIIVALK